MAANCERHSRYQAGCLGCKKARKIYSAGPGGIQSKRSAKARLEAWKALEIEFPEKFQEYYEKALKRLEDRQ